MKVAMAEAEKGLQHNEMPVGCVIAYKNGTIIEKGYNETNVSRNALQHAEMVVLQKILSRRQDPTISQASSRDGSTQLTSKENPCPELSYSLPFSYKLNELDNGVEPSLSSPSVRSLKNCVLYVSVEPCIMCTVALRLVNLSYVFFGCKNAVKKRETDS